LIAPYLIPILPIVINHFTDYAKLQSKTMDTAIENLNELDNLLRQLTERIDADEETQWDENLDIMTQIDDLCKHHDMLHEAHSSFNIGVYDAKGALSEVREEIQGLKDASLQQRCFYLLTEGM
jgi:hypothetical protein